MIYSIYIINRSKRKTRRERRFIFFIKGKYFLSRLKTFSSDINIDINSPAESELALQKSSSNSTISTLKSFSDPKDADLIYYINKVTDI